MSERSCDSLTNASGDSSSTHEVSDSDGINGHEVRDHVARDSKLVLRWKIAVCFSLLVTSALVVGSTYFFFSNEEEVEFETAFAQFARSLSDASHFHARNIIETFEGTADVITSHALSVGVKWPFVTIPDFEVRFAHVRVTSFTEFVGFSPLVYPGDRLLWEKYSVERQDWILESAQVASVDIEGVHSVPKQLHVLGNQEQIAEMSWGGRYAPMWQMSPPPFKTSIVNTNLRSDPAYATLLDEMEISEHSVISGIWNVTKIIDYVIHPEEHEKYHSLHHFRTDFHAKNHPHSVIVQPIYNSFSESRNLVGFLEGVLSWDAYLVDLLPTGVDGIICVMENTCGEVFTYEVDGHEAFYLGMGDLHEPKFDKLRIQTDFAEFDGRVRNESGHGQCHYNMSIYPSSKFRERYNSVRPELFTTAIAFIFIFTSFMFFMFIFWVYRRQRKILTIAEQTNTVVSSLFPANVRNRIMKDVQEQVNKKMERSSSFFSEAPKRRLKSFLHDEESPMVDNPLDVFNTKPIADFFSDCTILFADIAGFTAWSSVREPSQVFQLLETIYHSFDQLAKSRRIFKVETVGDCYVAVTGLPDPRRDHAVAMARFARACLLCVRELTKKMEVTLGPDTGDLSVRFGLHSGPVTAGVLRGEKCRFQLFGDTVNTASKMEQYGVKDRIHLSNETADLLAAAGKSKWIIPREDTVSIKGKGELETFWLAVHGDTTASIHSSNTYTSVEANPNVNMPAWHSAQHHGDDGTSSIGEKLQRRVDWNVDQLIRLLKPVVARRNSLRKKSKKANKSNMSADIKVDSHVDRDHTVLEEVKEVIVLPNFDKKSFKGIEDPASIELGSSVVAQLHDYVTHICKMYRDNAFHNFEHASHVTMSVCKLLSRIVSPDDVSIHEDGTDGSDDPSTRNIASVLHDHTYGITSDPLTQFSVAFAALIHDVDHSGVPNSQLIKENSRIASLYKNKSVAEQNSVDLAWELLMNENYAELRSVIYSTESELSRFRQLVVNSVMATDIVDKELKALRDKRWEKAFSAVEVLDRDLEEDRNRKATIVIEHLIQASDVAHTMQHWHIYRKWNERFFRENYLAYKAGRAENDPSDNWYKGEIGFFDFYIIPLAKKLKNCGVFGVSSDEYLNYAMKNREEWVKKGKTVVGEMLENVKDELACSDDAKDEKTKK